MLGIGQPQSRDGSSVEPPESILLVKGKGYVFVEPGVEVGQRALGLNHVRGQVLVGHVVHPAGHFVVHPPLGLCPADPLGEEGVLEHHHTDVPLLQELREEGRHLVPTVIPVSPQLRVETERVVRPSERGTHVVFLTSFLFSTSATRNEACLPSGTVTVTTPPSTITSTST